MRKIILNGAMMLILCIKLSNVFANDGPSPPSSITSATIIADSLVHLFDDSHFKVIGACLFLQCHFPIGCWLNPTLELDEYLPDLVVTSYTGHGNDPWIEANDVIDKAAYVAGNATVETATGLTLTDGRSPMMVGGTAGLGSRMARSVDVIGSPFNFVNLPFPTLQRNTHMGLLYYNSDLDALMDRSGIAEGIREETWNPLGHYIGKSFIDHWGYEFPRTMIVDVDNEYKAAVIAALHAADIVTNKNTLHVVHSVSDSCGTNCAVANVIEEQQDTHEIWQMIYPNDVHIHPGQDDSLQLTSMGTTYNQAGHGNYVFVLWRHYKGCMQAPGKLIYATVTVPPTKKR